MQVPRESSHRKQYNSLINERVLLFAEGLDVVVSMGFFSLEGHICVCDFRNCGADEVLGQ